MSNKPYTTRQAVANYMGTPTPSGLDNQVDQWILAMSRQADKMANRVLFDDAVQTYKYDGDGSDLLVIEDAVDISEVTIDGITPTEVTYYPQNKPYVSRIHVGDMRFNRGRGNVEVTGIMAMSKTLLPDVEFAVTVLVAGLLNSRLVQGKVGTTEKIGNYSVTYREESQALDFATAKATLAGYRRIPV